MIKTTATIYLNASKAALWHFGKIVERNGQEYGRVGTKTKDTFARYLQRDLLATLEEVGYFDDIPPLAYERAMVAR
jgi:hypothetical protein